MYLRTTASLPDYAELSKKIEAGFQHAGSEHHLRIANLKHAQIVYAERPHPVIGVSVAHGLPHNFPAQTGQPLIPRAAGEAETSAGREQVGGFEVRCLHNYSEYAISGRADRDREQIARPAPAAQQTQRYGGLGPGQTLYGKSEHRHRRCSGMLDGSRGASVVADISTQAQHVPRERS